MNLPGRLDNWAPPSRADTALVVVTFHPDEGFASRLVVALAQFEAVFLVDNTASVAEPAFSEEHPRLHRQNNSQNAGLGVALNQGCRAAVAAGFEWVVTLDQDTQLDPCFLEAMIQAWRASEERPALLGCNYLSVSRGRYKIRFNGDKALRSVKTVITSGTLMHLATWSSLGGFREDFFIDAIDHEICLRARGAGFHVAIYPEPLMEHVIGTPSAHDSIIGAMLPYSHSPLRNYTNARNTTCVLLQYSLREPLWSLRRMAGLTAELLAIAVLEKNKRQRLLLFFKGVGHGLTRRMGPFPGDISNG